MEKTDDLELKLIDRALEQHENTRAIFFRDLKIVAVALLVFQFFVFFRFASLSDRGLELQPKLAAAQGRQSAVQKVQGAMQSFKSALENGTAQVTELLRELPQNIRDELVKLDAELQSPRERRAPSPAIQQVTIENMPNPGTQDGKFAHMRPDDRQVLLEQKPESAEYQQAVFRVVETGIVQPVFTALNEEVGELLAQPLSDALEQLRGLSQELSTLRAAGADVDGWIVNANRVAQLAADVKFNPPAAPSWWTTARGKMTFSATAQTNTGKIAAEAKATLARPEANLATLAQTWQSNIAELTQQQERLTTDMTRLEAQAKSIEGMLEGYAKPLAVVALNPKELVLYYPVLLTALIIMFVVRERALDRRAVALASAYRARGISDRTLALCFGAAQTPAAVLARESYFWSHFRSTFLFRGVPIAAVIVSFAWILASESLGPEAPRGVYLIAVVLLAVTCGVQLFNRASKCSTAAKLGETA